MDSDREYSVLRGNGARFTFDSRFVVYTISPDPELIKKLRKQKKRDAELPKPRLEILDLETGKHVTIPRVRGFSMPAEAAGWVAFNLIEDADSETVTESTSELTETYEITPEGVRRQQEPKKKSTKEESEEEESAESKEEQSKEKPSESGKEENRGGRQEEKGKGKGQRHDSGSAKLEHACRTALSKRDQFSI